MHANKDTMSGIKMRLEEEMCDGERYEGRNVGVSEERPF